MKLLNKAFAKTIAATTAAGAMAVSAVPAHANDRHNDRISTGEVIAGAVIIGGLAAVLASKKKDRKYDDRYDNRYDSRYDNRGRGDYNNRGRKRGQQVNYRRDGSRQAINQCVRFSENKASYRGRANVTQIRDIDETRYGYRVRGDITVNQGRRGRYSDNGRFTCYVENGRVSDVQFRGLGR